MSSDLQEILAAIEEGRVDPLYLVSGDRVLAEPAAERLGAVLAEKAGCEAEVYRRPQQLGALLSDLRTFSLFSPAKIIVAVETAVVADRSAAADLIDAAAAVLPLGEGVDDLTVTEKGAAGRLLQALYLFQIDAESGSAGEALGQLPEWAFQGGAAYRKKHARRGRPRRQVETLRTGLVQLLDLGRATGLSGWAESDIVELAEIVQNGLPRGHSMVLAESSVAVEHPLVKTLAGKGCLLKVGQVESDRGKQWQGVDLLVAELERETSVGISKGAVDELARRTLRKLARSDVVDAESTARLAAEYRKLATIAGAEGIDRKLVASVVEDRGEQDVWAILDAVGGGQGGDALSRLQRHLASAEDAVESRLRVFGLLAEYARQLVAVGRLLGATGVQSGEKNYSRFKSKIAPMLQGELPGGRRNPLSGIHPYRLHKAYLAASRMNAEALSGLSASVLETETKLKGESGNPDAALCLFVAELSEGCR